MPNAKKKFDKHYHYPGRIERIDDSSRNTESQERFNRPDSTANAERSDSAKSHQWTQKDSRRNYHATMQQNYIRTRERLRNEQPASSYSPFIPSTPRQNLEEHWVSTTPPVTKPQQQRNKFSSVYWEYDTANRQWRSRNRPPHNQPSVERTRFVDGRKNAYVQRNYGERKGGGSYDRITTTPKPYIPGTTKRFLHTTTVPLTRHMKRPHIQTIERSKQPEPDSAITYSSYPSNISKLSNWNRKQNLVYSTHSIHDNNEKMKQQRTRLDNDAGIYSKNTAKTPDVKKYVF